MGDRLCARSGQRHRGAEVLIRGPQPSQTSFRAAPLNLARLIVRVGDQVEAGCDDMALRYAEAAAGVRSAV